MPVNMNRLIATNEVRLKPGVDSVSETKTSIVETGEDRVMRFLGINAIIGCAKVHVSEQCQQTSLQSARNLTSREFLVLRQSS